MKNSTAIIALFVALSACAAPQTSVPRLDKDLVAAERQRQIDQILDGDRMLVGRVADMSYRFFTNNYEFCKRRGFNLGYAAGFGKTYPKEYRERFEAKYGSSTLPTVLHVVPGSQAEKAGLAIGDTIMTIDGVDFDAGHWKTSRKKYGKRIRQLTEDGGALELSVDRHGEKKIVTFEAEPACNYGIAIIDDQKVNAFADGKNIYFTRGMLNFALSETELALVLGHELAHNTEGHIAAKMKNAAVGSFFGLLIDVALLFGGVNTGGAMTDALGSAAAMSFSTEFEIEADYVGLYMMQRAGYEIDGAEAFWQRMGAQNVRSVVMASTHPSTPERFLTIQSATEEIYGKLEAGEALVPNRKQD